jgi:hypothetical protein
VLITLAVSLLCTVALAFVSAFGRYNTAEMTLEKLVKTLRAADVDTLLEDTELGLGERTERDIMQRGLEEYNQILSAFSSCSTEGLAQYRKLKQTVMLKGEEAFKKLPGETQRQIKDGSKDRWVLQAGLEALGPEARYGIDDPGVLMDEAQAARQVGRVGLEVLASQGVTDLPDLETLESWSKKAKPSQKALLARVRAAGQEAIDKILKDATSAGLKRLKGLNVRDRKSVQNASYRLWVVTKGIDLLDEQDRDMVSGPEMFLDTADEEDEARRLCLLILPPAQRALIEGRNYHDFMAKRDDYIHSTGKERYQRFLGALFKSCKYDVVESRLSGEDPLDLFRISKATLVVRWRECQGGARLLGEELTFRYEAGTWRFEASPQEPAPEPQPPPAEQKPAAEPPAPDSGGKP